MGSEVEQMIADELAKLTPEQRAELEERARFQQMLNSPVKLPLAFDVQPLDVSGEPGVIVILQTPTTITRTVILRDAALALASQIRKAATTGPGIITPNGSGLVVPR